MAMTCSGCLAGQALIPQQEAPARSTYSNIIGLHDLTSALEGGAELLMDGRSEVLLLPHGLDATLLPRHVALIMDGKPLDKRTTGAEISLTHRAVITCSDHLSSLQAEVEALLQLFEWLMHRLPLSLQSALDKLEQSTAQKDGLKVSIAMNYGKRYDLVQACQGIAADARDEKLLPCDVSQVIEGKLLTRWMGANTQHSDLVIQTSGDKRISNFLLWQSAYAELCFLTSFGVRWTSLAMPKLEWFTRGANVASVGVLLD
ncbi:hypothetical protein L7F22_031285 [Adiantum nelumboides]|nr:hypothetical protein [Adiantum nelumboides]